MGYYDDIYTKAEREEVETETHERLHKIRILGLKDILHKKIEEFTDAELEFAKEVLVNLNDYKGFFAILDRSRK